MTVHIERDGNKWYHRELHLVVDATFDELVDAGFGADQPVGAIVLHLSDGYEVSIASGAEHALKYRSEKWGDVRPPDHD